MLDALVLALSIDSFPEQHGWSSSPERYDFRSLEMDFELSAGFQDILELYSDPVEVLAVQLEVKHKHLAMRAFCCIRETSLLLYL